MLSQVTCRNSVSIPNLSLRRAHYFDYDGVSNLTKLKKTIEKIEK